MKFLQKTKPYLALISPWLTLVNLDNFQISPFKVKAPSGTPFIVRKEAYNEYDPFALACLIPAELELIPEPLRKMAIYSKSKRKSYTLEDVRGSQIGRIQYFLNRELFYLLECGKISRIEG